MDLSKLCQYIPIIAVNFKLDTCKDHYDGNQARCFLRANFLFVTIQNMFCVSFKKDVFLGKIQKPNRTLVLRIIINSPTPHSVGNWVRILLMKKKLRKQIHGSQEPYFLCTYRKKSLLGVISFCSFSSWHDSFTVRKELQKMYQHSRYKVYRARF